MSLDSDGGSDDDDDSSAPRADGEQLSGGLSLNPASINALANALQKSLPKQHLQQQSRDQGDLPAGPQDWGRDQTSTPTDKQDNLPR